MFHSKRVARRLICSLVNNGLLADADEQHFKTWMALVGLAESECFGFFFFFSENVLKICVYKAVER